MLEAGLGLPAQVTSARPETGLAPSFVPPMLGGESSSGGLSFVA